MQLIVGLGNPGDKYKNTRHNVGFMVVEALVEKINQYPNNQIFKWENSKKFNSLIINNQPLIIICKPQTFMNDSGIAVASLATYYKLPATSIYVIHDDLDVKLGEYKIQKGVGPKVHNGVNSIEEKLGSKDFWRVRVGIENRIKNKQSLAKQFGQELRIKGEDYVLQNFTEEEKTMLNEVVDKLLVELDDLINKK